MAPDKHYPNPATPVEVLQVFADEFDNALEALETGGDVAPWIERARDALDTATWLFDESSFVQFCRSTSRNLDEYLNALRESQFDQMVAEMADPDVE